MKKATIERNAPLRAVNRNGGEPRLRLEPELLLKMRGLMLQDRLLEERLIKMYKQSDGYFWIGGAGEEAFNVALGLQILAGEGVEYDILHLHYRASGVLLCLGMEPISAMRQMKNTASDPHSGGRNFAGHFSMRSKNVVPITSTIETQYSTAIGSAIAQKRVGGRSITIVTGGEAGTAEGDFASALVWSSRPGFELPLLIVVTNNSWGISTPACTQHGEKNVADRGTPFGIRSRTINGNDPEEAYLAIREAMEYVRGERKPYLLEAKVSRLYGHSSASGANLVPGEEDCLATFEAKLEAAGLGTKREFDEERERLTAEFLEMAKRVREEPLPDASTIHDFTYWGQKGRYW